MHEKWLRDDLRDRSDIPHSLKVFDGNIECAIHRHRDGEMSVWEAADSQWRARVKAWARKRFWFADMWGPPPDDPACRAPNSVLAEVSS